MIQYEDFSIKIEPQREDVYPVIVLRSPAGEGRSSFHLPFDPADLGDLLVDLGQTIRGTGQRPTREAAPGATRSRPQQIGDQLFNALFSGPVRSLLDQSLGMIRERQKGLRIPESLADDGSNLSVFAAHSHDATGILLQHIEQVAVVDASDNLVIGRQALARAVRATPPYPGITSIIHFDEKGDRMLTEEEGGTLPGTETVPLSEMARSIPWLPYDSSAVPTTMFYIFNLSKPPFDDALVRQALASAVDRSALADIVEAGGNQRPLPATSLTPPNVLGRDLYGEMGLAFDPSRAAELLAQAGYPNGDGFPQTTLMFNCSEGHQPIAQALVEMWADHLSINVGMECIDGWDSYVAQLESDAPALYRMGWVADVVDPDNFLDYSASGNGASQSHFSDATSAYAAYATAICAAAIQGDNPAQRQLLYIKAERILCEEEAVIIPLYHYYGQQ